MKSRTGEGGSKDADSPGDLEWFASRFASSVDFVDQTLQGKREVVSLLISALIAGGHVLIEDVPGTGKSVLAGKLADMTGGTKGVIYFTPDILPTDLTGYEKFVQPGEMEFVKGPLFVNVFLADALNRASPKTQSALLAAMESGHISIDRRIVNLPTPFFVIATQNPLEEEGTYPLPRAQWDRFMLRVELGYPPPEVELTLLQQPEWTPITIPASNASLDLAKMRRIASSVYISDPVGRWMLEAIMLTRQHRDTRQGVSTRAARSAVKLAQVWAAHAGREYLIPEDFSMIAVASLAHRIHLTAEAQFRGLEGKDVIIDCLSKAPLRA
jgi:MoxR-like ATPase